MLFYLRLFERWWCICYYLLLLLWMMGYVFFDFFIWDYGYLDIFFYILVSFVVFEFNLIKSSSYFLDLCFVPTLLFWSFAFFFTFNGDTSSLYVLTLYVLLFFLHVVGSNLSSSFDSRVCRFSVKLFICILMFDGLLGRYII